MREGVRGIVSKIDKRLKKEEKFNFAENPSDDS